MKLNEVKEIGFYKAIKDERPDYIFEVIKNTDEEWLKDNPKAIFLVDEWGYEYTDDDDRRHYETFGSLTQVKNADEIEVEKMTENFIVSGKVGNHLIEDKPTYKEKYLKMKKQFKRLQEENEELRQIRKNYPDIQEPYIYLYRQIKKQCHKLQGENKRLQMLSYANCGEKYLSPDGSELYEKNVQLQKENEELKEKTKSEKYIKVNALQEATKYSMKCGEFRQALEEIKDRLIMPESLPENYTLKKYILEKCNEVLNDRD